MKIVLAPDSFKGTLSSAEVCRILREAFNQCLPEAEVTCLPMADGGEGSLAAVIAATGAEVRTVSVLDPLGREIQADFALLPQNRGAFIEMAAASGLERLRDDERDPMIASTYGTGQLVRAALDAGATTLTIGIGGSATVDGGAGFAQALGYRLLDAAGRELPPGGGSLRQLAKLETSSAIHGCAPQNQSRQRWTNPRWVQTAQPRSLPERRLTGGRRQAGGWPAALGSGRNSRWPGQ